MNLSSVVFRVYLVPFMFREIKAKTIITKSNLPDSDYVINPYVGCFHSCIYCYARFMKKFTGHSEPWGTFCDVKINAAELIPEATEKYKNKTIFMSSVTDPYHPLEKKYKLTRQILQKLIPLQPHLCIQSKSDSMLRDIDLLKQFSNCEVGFTITTLDDSLRKEIEPFTSSIQNRLEALQEFKKAGIKTYIFIGPIMPYLTDWKGIVQTTKKYADSYIFENLNVSGTIWAPVSGWLKNKHPDLLKKYQDIYPAPRNLSVAVEERPCNSGCRVYFSKNDYWSEVEKEIRQFCSEQKIKTEIYFHH